MKAIAQVVSILFLSLIQIVFLPINLTLLFILSVSHSKETVWTLGLLVLGSFFVSVFGNLNFGLTLTSFAASLLFSLILRRYLPNRGVSRVIPFIVVLVFWEIFFKFELYLLSEII